MGFDGAAALQPLSYTGLAEYGIPDGVIPEPSNDALSQFVEAISSLSSAGDDVTGAETLARAHQAAADLCSGEPSAEQFASMPPRLFREFIKWLASEFADPKG